MIHTAVMIPAFLITAASFLAMEGMAWGAHKYIMHGPGWGWHRDHHERHNRPLERNDLYGVVGAAMSIAMFAIGSPVTAGTHAWWPATWMGLGILGYGLVYSLVHDGLVHQRWFRYVPRDGYARRLVQAHRLHHATLGREGGVSFGFLFAGDPAVLKRRLGEQQRAGLATLRDAHHAQN